jgi:hypothetical protein
MNNLTHTSDSKPSDRVCLTDRGVAATSRSSATKGTTKRRPSHVCKPFLKQDNSVSERDTLFFYRLVTSLDGDFDARFVPKHNNVLSFDVTRYSVAQDQPYNQTPADPEL